MNWYTGAAHGLVRNYGLTEPPYERLRVDVIRWLKAHPDVGNR